MKSLLLGTALLFSVSALAHADTSGQLILSGVIPPMTSIKVDAAPGSNSLDLVGGAEAGVQVASVTEQNNTRRGYYVTLQSMHGGKFDLQNDWRARHFNKIPYSASYDGKSVELRRWPKTIYRSSRHELTAQNPAPKAFSVSFAPQDPTMLIAGSYSDTLTFTINAR